MKKRLIVPVALILLISLLTSACASPAEYDPSLKKERAAAAVDYDHITKDNIKIGFVHYGDPSDQGYTWSQDQATWKMVEDLGLKKSQIVNKYNVPDTEEAATAFRELAEEGCQVIFSTSHGHEDYMINVAREYPDITFCHYSGVKANSAGLSNFHNYYGQIAEARFLSGVVAALSSKTGQIGYVAAMDSTLVNNGVDAYYCGAKSVNPDIQVKTTYLNTWYDPNLESQATQSLIDSGCDVISHHADSTAGATTCEKNNCLFISYMSDMSSVAPDAVLTSILWDTSSYLELVINDLLEGKKDEIPVDYTGSIDEHMVYLNDINEDLLDSATAQKIEQTLKEDQKALEDGSLAVFTGPLYDTEGNELLGAGEVYREPQSSPSFGTILQGIDLVK